MGARFLMREVPLYLAGKELDRAEAKEDMDSYFRAMQDRAAQVLALRIVPKQVWILSHFSSDRVEFDSAGQEIGI